MESKGYIHIYFPVDGIGDLEHELARGLRRKANQFRNSAFKRTKVLSKIQPARSLWPLDDLTYITDRAIRADALIYQLNSTKVRYGLYQKNTARFYLNTSDLRQVLVALELPFTHERADPWQLAKDIGESVQLRVRALRRVSGNGLKMGSNADKRYASQLAKSLVAVRVGYGIERMYPETYPGGDQFPYHYVQDAKSGKSRSLKYDLYQGP